MEQWIMNNLPYLLGLATMWGTLLWRVKTLEKKMDKHNNIVERLYQLEVSFKDEKEVCNRRFNIIEKVLPRVPKGDK